MQKQIIENFTKEFNLKENIDYPDEGKTIYDFIDFMKKNVQYEVPIYNSIIQKFFDDINLVSSYIDIKHLENLYDCKKFNIMEKKEYTVYFDELKLMYYASGRSIGNELVYSKKNAISGTLVCLHSFIFKEKYEEKTITGMREPLDGVSLYKFDNYSILRAGSAGNHRLFGCILFAPLLGKSNIILKNLNIYTPKDTYIEELLMFKNFVDFFNASKLYTKIIIQNDSKIELEVFEDKKNDPYNYIFRINKMKINKAHALCKNELNTCLQHIVNIRKKDKNFKVNCHYYDYNNELTFNTSKDDNNIHFRDLIPLLYKYSTPMLTQIIKSINIFNR